MEDVQNSTTCVLRNHELMTAVILINLNFIRETSQENYLCPSGFAVC